MLGTQNERTAPVHAAGRTTNRPQSSGCPSSFTSSIASVRSGTSIPADMLQAPGETVQAAQPAACDASSANHRPVRLSWAGTQATGSRCIERKTRSQVRGAGFGGQRLRRHQAFFVGEVAHRVVRQFVQQRARWSRRALRRAEFVDQVDQAPVLGGRPRRCRSRTPPTTRRRGSWQRLRAGIGPQHAQHLFHRRETLVDLLDGVVVQRAQAAGRGQALDVQQVGARGSRVTARTCSNR